jgi:agmatine deiminase
MQAGFRWPAEWERHEATLLAWPHEETTWPGGIERAQAAVAQLAAAVGRGEVVHVLVNDAESERRAAAVLAEAGAGEVRLHHVETADAWIRDYGPITLVREGLAGRERLALDLTFNAWGRKYEELLPDDGIPLRLRDVLGFDVMTWDHVLEGGSVDGNGVGAVLTTEQCLLHPNRNPGMDRAAIECALGTLLGTPYVLWLGEGIAGDDTDGHVDDIARFVGPRTVLAGVQPDPADPDHAPLADNRRRLARMTDPNGRPLEIVEVPMPAPVYDADGRRLPATHLNFYVSNAAVCVPVFGGDSDEEALRILGRCFADREVVPIRCEHLVEGFGALHCVTQQVPA